MSNFSNVERFVAKKVGAAAGTVTVYETTGDKPVFIKGYQWLYEAAEANVDNTFDFAVEYSVDGTNWVNITTNANPAGLLDTGAVLDVFDKMKNVGAGGAAATADAFSPVRVPANAVIRYTLVTAGTGAIPAIIFTLYGTPA